MHLARMLCGVCLAWAMVACSVNPVTGQRELTFMSASQEVSIGEQHYRPYQQQQGGLYILDPEVGRYVNEVGQKLARVSDRPELPYEFVVINSSVPNAWALPGGKIAINRGLLVLMEDEAELAAVLGHEIVHAAARHTARQHTRSALMGLGVVALGAAAQRSDYGQWIAAGAGLGATMWQAHYSRDQEFEADEFGIRYMVAAGYDPEGAVGLQKKLLSLSEGRQAGMLENLFASHPPSQARVDRNRELAQQKPSGTRNKAAYDRALAQIRRDQPAYDAHQQAIAAAQQEDFSRALTLTEQAIQAQPREALFHATKGQLLMANSDYSQARTAFRRATELHPEYYLGFLGLGLTAKRLNQNQEAERALTASMGLLQTPLASYHLGELALANNQRDQARSYFQFAAQAGGELGQAAQAQLKRMDEGQS